MLSVPVLQKGLNLIGEWDSEQECYICSGCGEIQ